MGISWVLLGVFFLGWSMGGPLLKRILHKRRDPAQVVEEANAEADRLLYALDPAFAIEMGYDPNVMTMPANPIFGFPQQTIDLTPHLGDVRRVRIVPNNFGHGLGEALNQAQIHSEIARQQMNSLSQMGGKFTQADRERWDQMAGFHPPKSGLLGSGGLLGGIGAAFFTRKH